MGVAVFWSALKTRSERGDEVRAEAGTIATTAAALLNEYFGGIDATASTLVRHPVVRSLDGPASTKLFQTIQAEQPLIGNVTLRDVSGALLASAVPFSAKNPLPALVLQQVIDTGRPATSQLVVGSIVNKNTVVMGYPVKDDARRCSPSCRCPKARSWCWRTGTTS